MHMCGMCMRVCVRACVRACMCTCMCIRVYAYVRSGISTSTACVGQQKIDDTLGRGTKDALRRAKRASGRAGAGARQDKTGRVTGRVATQGATMQGRRAESGEDESRERRDGGKGREPSEKAAASGASSAQYRCHVRPLRGCEGARLRAGVRV